MKACLVQVTSSCGIERVFSVFTLYDTTLNQAAAPDEVEEMIVIMKETPTWKKFDSMSVTIIWQQTNPGWHGLSLPLIPNDKLSPCDGKFWVKPVWMIHEASLKRKQKFEAIMEIDDKTEKNVDGMEIDELDDPD